MVTVVGKPLNFDLGIELAINFVDSGLAGKRHRFTTNYDRTCRCRLRYQFRGLVTASKIFQQRGADIGDYSCGKLISHFLIACKRSPAQGRAIEIVRSKNPT